MKIKYLLILLSFFCLAKLAISQTDPLLSDDQWVKKLSNPDDKKNEAYMELCNLLGKTDNPTVFDFIQSLEERLSKENSYYQVRFYCLKSYVILYKRDLQEARKPFSKAITDEVTQLMGKAMHLTYQLNDDYLTAMVSGRYGYFMYMLSKTEPAVMYMTNSAELYEKLNIEPHDIYDYITLSGLLWNIHEYESSIKYGLLTIRYLKNKRYSEDPYQELYMISTYNTIALSYQKMQQYDSAFVYYQHGLDIEQKIHSPVWKGIISGNMGQVYFAKQDYATALPLFEMDYTNSNAAGEFDNAANSLQWAAKTNLQLGKPELALKQVQQARRVLTKIPSARYLSNIYNTTSEIYKALGNKDSVFYYSSLYTMLNDSLERAIYQSSIDISKLRLQEEKHKYDMIFLQREKQRQIRQRNFIIGGILLAAIFALMFMNRKWHLLNHEKELALKEKELIEHDMASAKEQLKMFTKNIVEKTNLIEELELKLNDKITTAEEQAIITELSQQTILTEDDWDNFKALFEKVFPMFFQRLKSNTMDITIAEQRMAALTRLQLTSRQMASILGISVDSVHKTKQRLRRRLDLTTEDNLEEFIARI
ncbi:MAG: tetratricopeptide repeat protein [Prolixibacteraceae bacterium]|nr:tetratricopeptide repeat protein [Prolixibacteraceae bacterium]